MIVPTECHTQQMTCIAVRDRRRAGAFERRTRNPESLAVVSMQLHLDFQRAAEQVGEEIHRREIAGLGTSEREHTRIFDQEEVILLQVEGKPVGRQGTVAEAADKGVLAFAAPDRCAFRAKSCS